nr:MAG TPA: hypothetical protein [Caudoviricetes sp.]
MQLEPRCTRTVVFFCPFLSTMQFCTVLFSCLFCPHEDEASPVFPA